MLKIDTMHGHDRMSTQDLLLEIESAVRSGETDFEIYASGQHDIGGPLWSPAGKKLNFHVWNAGQRAGSMCMPNTEILIEESVPADVGWLNAGGIITVRGDAGDTAGHCSSGGKIYIGGRSGTRTGSLMKHDPLYDEPELWILKNVGSFSFEFMGGGKAIVCGYDCDEFLSVLGERPCVGMVGGVVYVRGPVGPHPADVKAMALEDEDIKFLDENIDEFLKHIGQMKLRHTLSNWSEWHKLVPDLAKEKGAITPADIKFFRENEWVKGGIFSDVAQDDNVVYPLVTTGLYRLRIPMWENSEEHKCIDCKTCLKNCPRGAISRVTNDDGTWYYKNEKEKCIGCSFCAGMCPRQVWVMHNNPTEIKMYSTGKKI